ncbi:unnamed protein product [Linum tenue]|uniref:Peptide N-acetyl-beta-D-glucosaminyl asparaginase amidase A N-terminal domain-containing protein n=1 Tax=Linum tenue TaxID=586396 RepID=A0AAV0KL16_9ROSI|nr:unnamed protein product [Linum tenue]
MPSSPLSSPHLCFLLLLLILCPFNSINAIPNLKRPKGFFHKSSLKQQSAKPSTVFQVTKPIHVPNTVPCKKLLLQHEFSSTADNPQVATDYEGPPSACGSNDFAKIVLESKGSFSGVHDDGAFAVWLGGVELLRSSSAQGFNTSVTWAAQKDITRYSSLLLKKEKQNLVVFFRTSTNLGQKFIGVYHLAISISFYPLEHKGHDPDTVNKGFQTESKADLILPISRNLESKEDGLWFEIENSTDLKREGFRVPQNAYRAVLEVYVSPHQDDRSWYSQYQSEFYNSNQFRDEVGNGPFRDVVITLDDRIEVGAIWPYPIIYGAGYDLWNPVVSIRSFDFPSYDVELTPFLGNLLDGRIHNLSFGIGNAANVWYIDANLHLWLDSRSSRTEGKLVSNYSKPLDLSSKLKINGPVAWKSWVEAERVLSSQGWVQSSHGNITTRVNQNLSYANYMENNREDTHFGRTVEQLIHSNDSVSFVNDSAASEFYSFESKKTFSLLNKEEVKRLKGEGDIIDNINIEIVYGDETRHESSRSKSTIVNSLKDQQSGTTVVIFKNYTFFSAVDAMNQSYHYQNVEDNTKMCYIRNINTFNASIVYDKENSECAT